ncbi:MAG: DEAD/DEAH box helicase [Saprospiraceae bacterium]|nr:DEAD/DEAH box helicase [Saprospiraceae bacterium]
MTAYQLLGLNKSFVQGLAEMGIEHPSYAQTQFIPAASRHDSNIVAVLKGGSVYQDVYGLSLLSAMDPLKPSLQGIVLCNTREQCNQVAADLEKRASAVPGLRILALPGSTSIEEQAEQVRGVQVVVAYPGRLVDLLTHGVINLHEVSHFVLHGGDELLNAGMREAIDILLMAVEHRRATWMLTASVTDEVKELVRRFMPQAREITIHDVSLAGRNIVHQYYLCRNPLRFPALKRLLSVEYRWRGYIICLTRNDGREIAEKLSISGIPARFIDSEVSADEYNHLIDQFTTGKYHWLIMTDVAVRSLQLPPVPAIIHYGIPSVPEVYYQRCRLLADMGAEPAYAASIITPKFEADLIDVSHQVNVHLERRIIPTPEDLTEARYRRALERYFDQERVEVPEHLMVESVKNFNKLTKGEIIQMIATAEYRRIREKALRETDLNLIDTPEPASTPASAPVETEEETKPLPVSSNGSKERLFVNIGQMDGVTESTFVTHLQRALGIPPTAISNIDLKRTHIHFDIDPEYAAIVRSELPKYAVKDRAVRVDDASPTSRDRPRKSKRR